VCVRTIATEAWSPLGRGNGVLEEPVVTGMAGKHGRAPAQVVLRWHLQLGNIVIPKSVTPARIRENLDALDFELDAEDLAAVETLETGARVGPDPDAFN
jgi:2,5-diketo-D-gluconate reductase A